MTHEMKKTFYTLMEQVENVHLMKDVGMFPYVLGKYFGYQPYIVSYHKPKTDFPYLQQEVKGVLLKSRGRYTGNPILDGGIWLWAHAKDIDILNLYHFKPSSFLWILIYKRRNPKGKVWLKLDIDANAGIHMNMRKGSLKWFLTRHILGKCSVVSAETKIFCRYAACNWPVKIDYIPNGVLKADIKPGCRKEKQILTVGRLGTKQKATETLIKAFQKAEGAISGEWKLVLAGPIDPLFEGRLYRYLKKYHLSQRVTYIGEITNRAALNRIYSESAVFTMPSRWESFGIAALEALSKGCYLLTTDLYSFRELNGGGRFGKCFPVDDVDAYARLIVQVCSSIDSLQLRIQKNELTAFLEENYTYENVCRKLHKKLSQS